MVRYELGSEKIIRWRGSRTCVGDIISYENHTQIENTQHDEGGCGLGKTWARFSRLEIKVDLELELVGITCWGRKKGIDHSLGTSSYSIKLDSLWEADWKTLYLIRALKQLKITTRVI